MRIPICPRVSSIFVLLYLFLLAIPGAVAQTVVVDFDRLPQSDTQAWLTVPSPYSEDGFVVEMEPLSDCPFLDLDFRYPTQINGAYPGSIALSVPYFDGYYANCPDPVYPPINVVIRRADDGVFDLRAIDVGCEYYGGCAESFEIKGTSADGRTAEQVCWAPPFGSSQLFATCTFDGSFQGLVRVEWPETARAIFTQFDNIVLAGAGPTFTPWISLDQTTVDFAQVVVGGTKEQTVTVTNIGDADLYISSVGRNDVIDMPFALDGSQCVGVPILPAGSCDIAVVFSPEFSGLFQDTFSVSSNDPYTPVISAPVRGEGAVLGGTATGIDLFSVTCENKTQKVKIRFPLTAEEGSWDCQIAGLPVSSGDEITMKAKGIAK